MSVNRPPESVEIQGENSAEWRQLSHLILQSVRNTEKSLLFSNPTLLKEVIDTLDDSANQLSRFLRLIQAVQVESDPRLAVAMYARLIVFELNIPNHTQVSGPDMLGHFIPALFSLVQKELLSIQGRSMALFKAYYEIKEPQQPVRQTEDQQQKAAGLFNRVLNKFGLLKEPATSNSSPTDDDQIEKFLSNQEKQVAIKEKIARLRESLRVQDASGDAEVSSMMMLDPFPPINANFVQYKPGVLEENAQNNCESFDRRITNLRNCLQGLHIGLVKICQDRGFEI